MLEKPKNNQIGNTLENIKRRLKELEEEYDRVEHSGIDTSKITIEIGDLQELDQKVENRLKELEVNLNIKNN